VITVRQATLEDSDEVLLWRNDPLAIAMSTSSTEVSAKQHAKWFPTTLNSDTCVHVIGESTGPHEESKKIGVCRFDREEGNQWRVSINLNPAVRGRGLSEELLRLSIAFWGNRIKPSDDRLFAEVLPENPASIKIFERNGFKRWAESGRTIPMFREFG
jgi:RimJ/RimL family protein N-acetyltransferase